MNMVLLYGQCNMNAAAAAREYAFQFGRPGVRLPSRNVILAAVNRGFEDGNLIPVLHRGHGQGVAGRPENDQRGQNEERVLNAVEVDPRTSIRIISREENLSYSFVQKVLKRNHLHAFHYRKVQALRPEDYPLRMRFCEIMLNRITEDDTFLDRVLFTDESSFGRDGTFNVHNHHQYALENPHLIVENKHQTRFTTNKWAGIIGDTIIGPIDFPERLTGGFYRDFLENRLGELLQRNRIENDEVIFQHDGAPAHTANATVRALDQLYPQRWIGVPRRDNVPFISWPARSSDLSPLDFFYWGAIKEKTYNSEIRSVEDLEERITQAGAAITGEMLPLQQSPLPLDAQNANGESSFSGSEQYNSPTFNRNIIDETGPILQEAEKNVNLSLGITKKMKACSVVINKKDLFWTKSFMVHDIVWASWGKWGWMPAIVTSKTAEILRMRFFSYNGIYKISNKNKVLHFRDKNIEDVKTSTKYESQLDNALASMNQYLNKENNIKNQ
uniref:DUF4817 domain-containing protein n=1 Tax=Trichogramma kaykai TaxID=54128 RepID=A0ABD2XEH1_9HYME